MIKLNKYNATNTVTKAKARVHYSAGKLISDDRECVTIYHKDYNDNLEKVFGNKTINDTDIMTDYFDKGKIRVFKGDALYEAALARANA